MHVHQYTGVSQLGVLIWLLCVPPGRPPQEGAPLFEWNIVATAPDSYGCIKNMLANTVTAAQANMGDQDKRNEEYRARKARCINTADPRRCGTAPNND